MCKVLIADDSEIMRAAIRRTLEEERKIVVVGEVSSFATMQKIADLKPDALLLDLHLPERRNLTPALVKSQLAAVRTVAVSFSNDTDSKMLAESYGVVALLDKMSLYTEMVPAILHCESGDPDIASLLRKPFNPRAHAA
jgi:DNA-binding NarL/FixJ family response regulator